MIVKGGLFLLIIMSLLSCNEKKIQYFKLNIVLDEPISNIKENEPLPPYLTTLMNYIDTNCTNVLYVPIITFERSDFNPPKTLLYEIPISGVNKFRKSLDMLSSINLREDYDDNIKKLVIPKILVESKGSIQNVPTTSQHKSNTFELQINENSIESQSKLSEKIKKALCDGKGNNLITIKVIDLSLGGIQSKDEISSLIAKADNLFTNRHYEEAQKIYIEIFNVNPQNEYVKKQLSEIGKMIETVTTSSFAAKSTITTITTKSGKTTASIVGDPPHPLGKITKTLKFDYGTYKGETLDGLRDGQGTMFFTQKQLISPYDLKKRYAEAGDYVSGTWVEGNVVNGKLFDKNGEQKEALLIGH